jgi:hypothetical protein
MPQLTASIYERQSAKLIFTFWRGVASSVLQRNYRLVARSGCAAPSQREVRERGRGS